MCMNRMVAKETQAKTTFLVKKDDSSRRDNFLVVANLVFRCGCGFGVACQALSLALPSFLPKLLTACAGTVSLLLGVLLKYWAHKSAEVFDTINQSPAAMESPCWKDGTYTKVDRYPLSPIGISWDHAFQIIKVQANYAIQFVKFLYWYRPLHAILAKEPTEQEIIHYALNSTILTLLDVDHEAECLLVKLQLDDMRCPLFEDGRKAAINVVFQVPCGDCTLNQSKIVTFSIGGVEITKRSEQLVVLATVTSTYIHPLLHSFGNGMYKTYYKLTSTERQIWDNLFLHGQYLNSVAHTFPADHIGISQTVLKEVLEENARIDLHNHGKTTMMLLKYSRFARFLVGTRKAIHKLVQEHQVPVNPEELFLTSVLHSMDHLTTGRASLYRNLDTKELRPQSNPYLLNYMWYYPSENVFTNLLKDHVETNDFYRDLYEAASAIDKDFADHISLSICF